MNNNKLPFMTQLQYAILAFGFIIGLFAGVAIMASAANNAYEEGRTAEMLSEIEIYCGVNLDEEDVGE